jgi:hypothetical protein
MKRHVLVASLAAVTIVAISACGGSPTGRITARSGVKRAHWIGFAHLRRPLDVVGPPSDGSLVVAAAGRLFLISASAQVHRFPGRYVSPGGEEPYIALVPSGCFGNGTVYALRLTAGRGVVAVAATGRVRRFATLRAPGLIDGIAFDRTGDFGHRLLVTINAGASTTVDAIDCRGRVDTLTRDAPRVEGGITVAPRSFGRFAGDLIAPDENSGQIFAITPHGQSMLVALSGLPRGGDIGVESAGFLPAGNQDALLADRLTPGNPHPGDDLLLRIGAAALSAAGVRRGDLLVTSEGGALTDAVRCRAGRCNVRFVADGPSRAHAEGHIAFIPAS